MARYSLDRRVLVLVGLADGPKHGYALMKDIQSLTGTRLGAGTLYGAIAKLVSDGMIIALPSEDRRQPYELTVKGRRELNDFLAESSLVTNLGLSRLAAK